MSPNGGYSASALLRSVKENVAPRQMPRRAFCFGGILLQLDLSG